MYEVAIAIINHRIKVLRESIKVLECTEERYKKHTITKDLNSLKSTLQTNLDLLINLETKVKH